MKQSLFLTRVAIGGIALLAWLLFFSTGLLIESTKYRRYLAPETSAAQLKPGDQPMAPVDPYTGSPVAAFVAATLCFTPTNLLFLTLLAGLLGGCSSNVVAERLDDEQSKQVEPRRLRYLEESPWSAMMRSFIVYLCVIAGLYFAIDDPFKNPTAAQYMRLAGTLSILAFVVGYDPSRIDQWIRLVPNPHPTQVVTVRGNKEGVEMTAAQGSIVARTPINGEESTPVGVQLDSHKLTANGAASPRRRRSAK
jgi:hypothetical protein